MRYFPLILFCLLCASVTLSVAQEKRLTASFNAGWKFNKGDVPGAQEVNVADQSWRDIDLPHDWSIEGAFSEEWASATGYLPAGIGWYRKKFELISAQRAKTIYLYFDGVYKNSEVWINGHSVGKRPNGHASFYYNITQYLHQNGKNVVAVKVDHTDFADSRWYTGSGINRNVYLIATDHVHISLWGVTFTTPEMSAQKVEVNLNISVKNNSSVIAVRTIKYELLDHQKKSIANGEIAVRSDAGSETENKAAFTVNKPARWSPESPNLYILKVSLYAGSIKTDDVTEQVGFRSFRFDANEGFFLNEKNLKLKGVCIHDDAGGLGTAVPKDVWERRLKILKSMGCNSIRMSHNPHQDYMYDLCDKLGLIVQDEAFDEWEVGKNKWIKGWNVGQPGKDGYHTYFNEWAERDLRDMILRNRNRTCIVMWSIGNEIDYPNDPYTHEVLNTGRNPQIYGRGYQQGFPPASRLGELSKRLVQVVKQYDTTRPVTAALAGVVMSNFTDYPGSLDIVGYNYQEYRYAEDHEKFPQRVIYGSENGKSYGAWLSVDTLKYIAAQYLWTGIDFMGEARSWPVRSSGAGLIDLAGFPKSQFYYRKSLWTTEPTIYIGTAKIMRGRERELAQAEATWNYSAGDSVRINCYTNVDEAELFLNGKSLGKKSRGQFSQKIIYWNTVYEPGELIVKGFKNNNEIKHSLRTAKFPVALQALADRTSLLPDKNNIAHIEISVNDEQGNIVYGAENEIELTIDGPGKLIGMESGSLTSHEDYKLNKRKAFNGRVLAYIRAEKAGMIKVQVKSAGLRPANLVIQAK